MSKKGKCPEFENHERWLVSYADMLTLLFAVFVVLFALKEGGEPQVQQTAGSMQESFNTPLEDIPLDRQSGPIEQGFGIFDHFHGDTIVAPVIQKYPANTDTIKIIKNEMAQVNLMLEERLYGPNKAKSAEDPGFARIIKVERTEKGFRLRLMARYFYDEGGYTIKKSTLKEIDAIIEVLKILGRSLTIEGHTDATAPKGKLSNWDISALRASHLVRYMIQQHQFPQTRLTAAGYGDTRPIAHNGTASGRKLNRRIEIHVDYDEPPNANSL